MKTVGFVELETNEMIAMNGGASNNREQKAQQAKLRSEWANTPQDRKDKIMKVYKDYTIGYVCSVCGFGPKVISTAAAAVGITTMLTGLGD